ncbi:MAG TPA: type II toxin-antitoxin system RelE/ParE family toxin [Planctomycetota bacterium]|nr:type II toxin-antitoxin system RelE/ParE family toxin [Planctomycetota bacterium]
MGKVIWSPPALDDLDSIAGYIARDSVDRASLFATRLIEATNRLVRFPQSGRVIPEIGDPSCREILVGVYRIMYRLEGDDVWITGIVHGARQWGHDQ